MEGKLKAEIIQVLGERGNTHCAAPLLLFTSYGAPAASRWPSPSFPCRALLDPLQDPAAYVSRDPEMAQTLLDQRQSGKQLLLITNRCGGAGALGYGCG